MVRTGLPQRLFVTACALSGTTNLATRRFGAKPFLPKLFVLRYANMGGLDPAEFEGLEEPSFSGYLPWDSPAPELPSSGAPAPEGDEEAPYCSERLDWFGDSVGLFSSSIGEGLQYVLTQIAVFHDRLQSILHKGPIYNYFFGLNIRSLERDLFQKMLHDCVQSSGSYVFRLIVHTKSHGSDLFQTIGRKLQIHSFGAEEGLRLTGQGIFRSGKNLKEIRLGKLFQLYSNGKAPLQFRN